MSDRKGKDHKVLSRREMLFSGTLAAGAAAMAPMSGCSAAPKKAEESGGEQAKKARARVKNIQLSLAAYSVREALTKGEMDLFGFIDWCAGMDLPGTELTSYYFKKGSENDPKYLHELRRHAFRQGVTISGTAIANDFCKPPGAALDKELAHVRQWIDNAAELYAPHIRIFAGRAPEGVALEQAITWCADGIKRSLEYAAERGVTLGLENHGGITARAADHLGICKAVGEHPWFGVNLDTGNYRTDAYEELAMAAPLAVNVQVKVVVMNNNGQSEPADLERLKKILVDSEYKGWVALEYEEEDPLANIPPYIEKMKKLFGCC
ncbi:MAG: sugar phosphate isomerase/epimerase family protein [Gemmatimonadota bacterium]|nr:sugar phosphate isomerase/epimerase family protein [Gemmatimonadota bacterium]